MWTCKLALFGLHRFLFVCLFGFFTFRKISGWILAQVVEHLCSKDEALSSIPSTAKKKKNLSCLPGDFKHKNRAFEVLAS
jgi:hypothetical protein